MAHVVLPELGEGIEKATVSYWLIEEGQEVKEGAEILEMATEKAVFNVPSPVAGILKKKLVKEGDEITVGTQIALIE